MNVLFKHFGFLVLGLGLTLHANAGVIFNLSDDGQTTTAVSGATVIDFNSGMGYASASGDYQIVSGSVSGQYAQPAGTNSPYLSVPNPVSNGSALFGLGTTANYFGLYWGSVDTYNSIQFYLDNALVASFGGSLIAPPADGNQTSSATNRYVNFLFTAGDKFDSVRLTSTGYAFESDNHAYASLPEPGTLLLLGIGLVGLGLARRHKKS